MDIGEYRPSFGVFSLQFIKLSADFFELIRHEVGLGLEKPFFRLRIGLEGRRGHRICRCIPVTGTCSGKLSPPSAPRTGAPASAAPAESAAPTAEAGGLHPVAAASSRAPAGHGASSHGSCSIISWHSASSFQFMMLNELAVLTPAPTAALSLAAAGVLTVAVA